MHGSDPRIEFIGSEVNRRKCVFAVASRRAIDLDWTGSGGVNILFQRRNATRYRAVEPSVLLGLINIFLPRGYIPLVCLGAARCRMSQRMEAAFQLTG